MADDRRLSIVPANVTRDHSMNAGAKVVALAIGTCTNIHGECLAGVPHLAELSGIPQRTVQRAIALLIDRGHLVRKRQARKPAVLKWAVDMRRHLGGVSSMSRHSGGVSSGGYDAPLSRDDAPKEGGMMRHRVASLYRNGGSTENFSSEKERSQASEEKRQPRSGDPEPTPLRGSLTKFLDPALRRVDLPATATPGDDLTTGT